MSRPLPVSVAIEELLRSGETTASFSASSVLAELGLFFSDAEKERTVATASLLEIASALPNEQETVASVFACEPKLRRPWLEIVAARLKEASGRRDAAELCNAVDQLGAASETIRELLANAKLKPTGFAELETELLGAPAEQAVVWPRLLRVIGATANLVEGGEGQPAVPVPPVALLDALTN